MAEEKSAKFAKRGYYGERHEARLDYYIGPLDKTHGHDEQMAPSDGNKGQFGNPQKGGDS